MAYQSLNQENHMNGIQNFIKNDGHDLPDWMTHERESAFKEYKKVYPKLSRTATWRNTKLDLMLDGFLEKDFKNLNSSHNDFDINTGFDELYYKRFFKAWSISLPVALVAISLVAPIVQKIVDKVIE